MKNKVIVYQAKNGAIELRGDIKKETLWATQAQIVDLFNVDQSVVSRHIKNIFKDGEIEEKSNMQKMHIANSDKPLALYSLDVVLSVGYRTNSKVAIEFRKWATSTLRQLRNGIKQMSKQANQKKIYAVAVRDGKELFLFLSICRSSKGDVYVNFPRDEPKWEPHSSYHFSGQHHHKSFNYKAMLYQRQRPDINFRGTENVVTTGIAIEELRALNALCRMEDYYGIFEISVSELRSEQYRMGISVDITDISGNPIIPNTTFLRQAIFKDYFPWISVTLYDTGPFNPILVVSKEKEFVA